mgnify:CR=1 FL=1
MKNDKNICLRRIWACLSVLLTIASQPVHADEFGLIAGAESGYQRLALNYQTAPKWRGVLGKRPSMRVWNTRWGWCVPTPAGPTVNCCRPESRSLPAGGLHPIPESNWAVARTSFQARIWATRTSRRHFSSAVRSACSIDCRAPPGNWDCA